MYIRSQSLGPRSLDSSQKHAVELTRKTELHGLTPGYAISYYSFPDDVDMDEFLEILKERIIVAKDYLDKDDAEIDLCTNDDTLIKQYQQFNDDIVDLVTMFASYHRLIYQKVNSKLSTYSRSKLGYTGISSQVTEDIRNNGNYFPNETIMITELEEYEEKEKRSNVPDCETV